MFPKRSVVSTWLVAGLLCFLPLTPLLAQDAPWRVEKASGEVWVTASGAQAASLTDQAELKPGDAIRTGKNGRVLLTRGTETILIAPNSAIDVPHEAKDGMTTTIEQAAGSILLDVEHRDVQHFEVVTPYLAAVVKGTQFRVTVSEHGGHVDVNRGQVEVRSCCRDKPRASPRRAAQA